MKKLFLLSVYNALILLACEGIKATVPDNTFAKESKGIGDRWVAAAENFDAEIYYPSTQIISTLAC
jgi:hypothetical protein